ncbi:hypothetical protein [Paenibacillus sp. RUD330]|uniref:hypothetical protein n=1 Tax=Paenibacillus sp. RUD330 TaxID=2023772 RepID=UPI000B926009|nr:hypothetical protein [Paenibacillus sp. RUD330]ASS66203.1 hypothetical protein CIC07_08625 [Paenibacillus sp. RUD330]
MEKLQMCVPYCLIEGVPADQSKTLQRIRDFWGEDEANSFIFEQIGPRYEDIMTYGSDELKEVAFTVTNGVAPGGKS